MPELPDVLAYLEALRPRLVGHPFAARVRSPFLLRTVDPPLDALQGKAITGVSRIGKRIVWELEEELFAVFHPMIAGRFHLRRPGASVEGKNTLAAFDLPGGTLLFTEASKRKRASLHLVRGEAGLAAFDAGGIDPLTSDLAAFRAALTARNHTIKRALTDPRIFDGIGNAYSDEILHRARTSPFVQTARMSGEQLETLRAATQAVLTEWIERLTAEARGAFPEKVTAFRPEMAVHGRYEQPCPDCGKPVQRIRYADKECNYCAVCQTGGKLLADRGLSRLLKKDWPKTLEELERLRGG